MGQPRVVRLFIAWMMMTGCAYSFTYGGGAPDRSTPSIFVQPLVDRTPEGVAGACVTDGLRARLGHPEPGKGVWTLAGEVVAIESGNIPVMRPGGVAAGLSEVRVRAWARLLDARGKVLWDSGERVGRAELMVGHSVSQTEDMRTLALERACRAVAEEIADGVLTR